MNGLRKDIERFKANVKPGQTVKIRQYVDWHAMGRNGVVESVASHGISLVGSPAFPIPYKDIMKWEILDCDECDGTGNFYRNDIDNDYLPCDDCNGLGLKIERRDGR